MEKNTKEREREGVMRMNPYEQKSTGTQEGCASGGCYVIIGGDKGADSECPWWDMGDLCFGFKAQVKRRWVMCSFHFDVRVQSLTYTF